MLTLIYDLDLSAGVMKSVQGTSSSDQLIQFVKSSGVDQTLWAGQETV